LATLPNYFFLDDKLYNKIRIIKSENVLVAWDYKEEKRVWLNYQQSLKRFQNAYKIAEVAELLGKKPEYLKRLIKNNLIDRGSGMSYSVKTRQPLAVYWSEDDVFNLRSDLFALAKKNEYGEPSNTFKLISEAELMAKIRGGDSYFIQDKNGNFVKVWRAI
jgi:hypothetical protein